MLRSFRLSTPILVVFACLSVVSCAPSESSRDVTNSTPLAIAREEPTPAAHADAQQVSGVGANPVIRRIPRDQWRRIERTGTWRPGCPVGRKDLRRLEVSYFDFDGREQRGVLVAHKDTIKDLAEIFTWMYETRFPIARMEPVEEYGGEVRPSLEANNTSAFNCRKPGQINAPVALSPHANGRAIDINPLQNPWKDPRCECWVPSREFKGPRAEGPGVIRRGSPVIKQFTDRGWIWQNIKVPDYMHFDTGYPSKARR